MPLSLSYQTLVLLCQEQNIVDASSTKYKQREIRIYAVVIQVTLRPKEMIYLFVT